jgi:hypothetical protein
MGIINFKFALDQMVMVEKLGIVGMVTVCAYSYAGASYYINTKNGGDWYNERCLKEEVGGGSGGSGYQGGRAGLPCFYQPNCPRFGGGGRGETA